MIIVIPDTHFPFHCKDSMRAMHRTLKKFDKKVTHIIQVGDLYDLYCLSRFPRSHDLVKPKQEILLARKYAADMWDRLQQNFPSAKCFQLIGNHDERLKKQVLMRVPELYEVVDMRSLWEFEGVKTMSSQREELIINDVVFIHGHYTRPGQHADYNQQNTVIGHTHKGWCVFRRCKDKIVFELNTSCMADLKSLPLSYTNQKKFEAHMNGFGVIDEFGPRFIPLMGGKTWRNL